MKKLTMVFILCWSTMTGAVPSTINFTGRLTNSRGPVNGAVDLTLKLYDVASGGTPLWSEIHNSVGIDNGLVFVDVGSSTMLDQTVLDGRRVYLEVVVGTETLSPRLAINSVPYAVRAAVATNANFLGASIGPDNVVTSVSGSNGITAFKTGNAVGVSLSSTGCTSGQVIKYNGTTFTCAPDADTIFGAGPGVSVGGTTIGLSTAGCSAGFVWKYNGTAFTCAPDTDTTYTAGNGIGITGTSISVNTGVVPQLASTNTFSGVNNFSSSSNSFTGNGAGLLGLNASNLGAGTVPSARVSGAYSGITSVGTLGNLSVSGSISRGTTGTANMVPIAYGNLNPDGSINSGSTPNFTVTRNGGSYEISIANENYDTTHYVTVVSIGGALPLCLFPTVGDNAGRLVVNLLRCQDNPPVTRISWLFSFVTYKP